MIFNWLDASKAVEFGIALADQLAPLAGSDPLKRGEAKPQTLVGALGEILARTDHGVRGTDLNFYKEPSSPTRSSGD